MIKIINIFVSLLAMSLITMVTSNKDIQTLFLGIQLTALMIQFFIFLSSHKGFISNILFLVSVILFMIGLIYSNILYSAGVIIWCLFNYILITYFKVEIDIKNEYN